MSRNGMSHKKREIKERRIKVEVFIVEELNQYQKKGIVDEKINYKQ